MVNGTVVKLLIKYLALPPSHSYTNFSNLRTLSTDWTIRGSNSDEGEIFHTRPDLPWGPPSLLYNGYWVSFPGVKRPGRGVNHQSPASTEVKERVKLYFYSLSGPSWPVLGEVYMFQFQYSSHWFVIKIEREGVFLFAPKTLCVFEVTQFF